MTVGKTSATDELSLVMSRSAISVFANGFTATRTATGLVQASTQWTRSLAGSAENPIDKPNHRTHQHVLERTQANS
jgi:hypothetical protein